ncbi:LytTR family transcriptional regulator DNA-binding domain-containing protein [Oceanobacillus chungangensis]|uniref:ABC transporter ATP-binding protein n=1 Tax=Oceanobacillus chungangensis TaxID=1229152 RepID=A0A3D8PP31_9BACI|nr:LytTR family transcriptional regulator DNA-binding domain-containing protein [Oceanobacillus chungangensis]RDW17412.1 ABC transporter ATP-binding protein [Oceanobacillus chungangensis]
MAILIMKDIEKHEKDTILFPSFHLEIAASEITAVYSTLNVRSTILDMLTGSIPSINGSIMINGVTLANKKSDYFSQVGICYFEDGLYERLTIKDYFMFIGRLYGFNQQYDSIFRITQLHEKRNKQIKELTFSEKKRVHYGKLLIQSPPLFIFEEPDLNVDMETKRIFISITKRLQEEKKAVLLLTGNMETAITIADNVYRLDENGLRLIQTENAEQTMELSEDEPNEDNKDKEPQPIQFNKIPTKVNDKIVLFDPPEIDYIESNDGQANIYIKGEAFTSSLTLANLEERLQYVGFFRCHRSYIVNLQKVREVITWTRNSYSLVLDDREKTQIPLSKTKMAELKDLLGLK